jgi:hypothetical protein
MLAILSMIIKSTMVDFGSECVNTGYVVAQMVEALRHKLASHGIDCNFSSTWSFQPQYGAGVNLVSNRNEHQEYFLGGKWSWYIGLTTLPPSRADHMKIYKPQPSGTLTACPGLHSNSFTLALY